MQNIQNMGKINQSTNQSTNQPTNQPILHINSIGPNFPDFFLEYTRKPSLGHYKH